MLDGSFFKRQLGPMPMWAWMGLGLGGALAVASWRSNKARSNAEDANTVGSGVLQGYKLPESLQPTYTFIDQDRTLVTVNQAPPGGGRPPDAPKPGPTPTPAPAPTPKPTPAPKPQPAPAPAGQWATVVKWAKGQGRGTPSTLWGIAEKFYGNGATWQQIWNAPQNAAVRGKRGAPEKIKPGDKIWVPTK